MTICKLTFIASQRQPWLLMKISFWKIASFYLFRCKTAHWSKTRCKSNSKSKHYCGGIRNLKRKECENVHRLNRRSIWMNRIYNWSGRKRKMNTDKLLSEEWVFAFRVDYELWRYLWDYYPFWYYNDFHSKSSLIISPRELFNHFAYNFRIRHHFKRKSETNIYWKMQWRRKVQ